MPDSHRDQTPLLPSCINAESDCQYRKELEQLREAVIQLERQVRTDALTGLHNFRFFKETLPLEMERTRRSGQTMALILLDIDHFKKFNDQWGHEYGNKALIHVASLINQTVRKLDVACRFGGEEFVIVLPGTDLAQAVGVAERLRETIAISPLGFDIDQVNITASIGVDEFKLQHLDTPENLLQRVDTWLYRAKGAGRNRVASPDYTLDAVAVSAAEKDALFGLWRDEP